MTTTGMHRYTFEAMTVGCEIQLAIADESEARQVAEEIIRNTLRLQHKYNFYDQRSWLNTALNQRAQREVSVDAETLNVLRTVKELSAAVDSFDITVGTLQPCFRQKTAVQAMKLRKRLEKSMGHDSWYLEDDRVCFLNDICRFDLGGVIKEHAVDQAVAIVRNAGISGALINFGGDLFVHGRKANDSQFVVAVKNPVNPSEMMFSLNLEDQALTTSGHYERSKQMGKRKVSHILGRQGTDERVLSVTVVSDTVLSSGVYSTALTLTPELSLADDMAAVFIDRNLQVHQSASGLEKINVD